MSNILTNFHMSICSQLCVPLWWFMHTKPFGTITSTTYRSGSTCRQRHSLLHLPSSHPRMKDMMQYPSYKVLSLLSTRKQFCQQICLIFVCVYIRCPPFIMRYPFTDDMIGNTLRLLFQCRVWYCCVGFPIGCRHRCMMSVHMVSPSS